MNNRSILEAILFVAEQPVPVEELAEVLEIPVETVQAELEDWSSELAGAPEWCHPPPGRRWMALLQPPGCLSLPREVRFDCHSQPSLQCGSRGSGRGCVPSAGVPKPDR